MKLCGCRDERGQHIASFHVHGCSCYPYTRHHSHPIIVRATTTLALVCLIAILPAALPGDEPAYPQDYFRSPIGIPILLAGNFAEMRDGHFHGGLDIKTNDAEGYRIYAAADGHISRVKVSPSGFGHALYVAHPNGFTTVYAHLSRFKGNINAFVRSQQYNRKSFAVDRYLKAGQFPVKKGDVIGLSGNTGSSSGPHLHFEIRRTSNQVPVNPLLFGFDIPDSRPPRIYRVRLYPMDETSSVLVESGLGEPMIAVGRGQSVTVDVEEKGGQHVLADADHVSAYGRIGLGIQTHDYHDGSRNRLGAYRITLRADGEQVYRSQMEAISFGNMRYINAHVDFAERKESRRWFQRSFKLPGNRLPIYELMNDGIITVRPGANVRVDYLIEDAYQNEATLNFELVSSPGPLAELDPPTAGDTFIEIPFGQSHTLARDGIRVDFPDDSFYDDVHLRYASTDSPAGLFSRVHHVHDERTPVHSRYTLAIEPVGLPVALRSKALVAALDEKDKLSSLGGSYDNGFVVTRTRAFGRFVIAVDTLAPEITSLDIADDQRLGRKSQLRFRVKDDLAGLSKYAGFVDGAWSIFAYDAKRDMLTYDIDPGLTPGRHQIRVEAEDGKGNSSELVLRFVR